MAADVSTTSCLTSHWAEVEGLSIHARISDEPDKPGAPTVILIHGMVVSSRAMLPTAELLAPSCRVFAPDLPGYGESDKPQPVPDVAGQADLLVAWMGAMGIRRSTLIANSYGCQVAASAAARYPERIDRLVLIGPTSDPQRRAHWKQMLRWQVELILEPRDYLAIMFSDYMKAGVRRALQTYRHMMADRIEESLAHVQVPTVIVRGSRDVLMSQEWAETAARIIPDGNGDLVMIPGAIHPLNYTDPLELASVVTPFLGLADDRSPPIDTEQDNGP